MATAARLRVPGSQAEPSPRSFARIVVILHLRLLAESGVTNSSNTFAGARLRSRFRAATVRESYTQTPQIGARLLRLSGLESARGADSTFPIPPSLPKINS